MIVGPDGSPATGKIIIPQALLDERPVVRHPDDYAALVLDGVIPMGPSVRAACPPPPGRPAAGRHLVRRGPVGADFGIRRVADRYAPAPGLPPAPAAPGVPGRLAPVLAAGVRPPVAALPLRLHRDREGIGQESDDRRRLALEFARRTRHRARKLLLRVHPEAGPDRLQGLRFVHPPLAGHLAHPEGARRESAPSGGVPGAGCPRFVRVGCRCPGRVLRLAAPHCSDRRIPCLPVRRHAARV